MMYCSHCGSSISGDLNYCKNCGARNERMAPVPRGSAAGMMGVGSVFIGIVGLIGFYPILRELLRSPLDPPAIVILMVVYLMAVFGMFLTLVRHSRKYSVEAAAAGRDSKNDYQSPQSFRSANTAQLVEPRDQPASVTEHTTRTLDQVHVTKN